MEIHEFIKHFADQFDDVPEGLQPGMDFRNIDGWSSLVALSVIAMTDEEYNVKLTGEDIRNSATLNDMFEKIKNKKSGGN